MGLIVNRIFFAQGQTWSNWISWFLEPDQLASKSQPKPPAKKWDPTKKPLKGTPACHNQNAKGIIQQISQKGNRSGIDGNNKTRKLESREVKRQDYKQWVAITVFKNSNFLVATIQNKGLKSRLFLPPPSRKAETDFFNSPSWISGNQSAWLEKLKYWKMDGFRLC